jgi:hypothetical protein
MSQELLGHNELLGHKMLQELLGHKMSQELLGHKRHLGQNNLSGLPRVPKYKVGWGVGGGGYFTL